MRQSILRELAVQSLRGSVDLEDHLQLELIQAAARENITVFEFIRERLLLKAGVSSLGALATLVNRLVAADRIVNGDHRPQPQTTTRVEDSPSNVAA